MRKVTIKHLMDLTGLTRRQVKKEISYIWPLMIQPGYPTYFEMACDVFDILESMKKRGTIKIVLDK